MKKILASIILPGLVCVAASAKSVNSKRRTKNDGRFVPRKSRYALIC